MKSFFVCEVREKEVIPFFVCEVRERERDGWGLSLCVRS